MSLRINIIAAVADNGIIGADGSIPWKLPEDLRYFKEQTMGHPVIMGRRTWVSIGRPLLGRTAIVLTHHVKGSRGAHDEVTNTGLYYAKTWDGALAIARLVAKAPDNVVWVAGGADVYKLALPVADGLFLTRVHARPQGDTYFPQYDEAEWKLVAAHTCASSNPAWGRFTYHRIRPAPL